ncbi:hypothetical protein GCM10023195_24590 [Actinoallomurus liliacearum]|uniref:GNAT family N-acetyltransferase n=1 Tax=Actinoallomurus liliacearum TaxID=1080073 RepID=A0ABP8TF57_9ACTN
MSDDSAHERYLLLMACGRLRLKPTTTRDLDRLPRYVVPDDVSPVDLLLAERDDERMLDIASSVGLPTAAPGLE